MKEQIERQWLVSRFARTSWRGCCARRRKSHEAVDCSDATGLTSLEKKEDIGGKGLVHLSSASGNESDSPSFVIFELITHDAAPLDYTQRLSTENRD